MTQISAVLINNTAPVRDVNGTILDCADGSIRFFEGRWYQWCMQYGLCVAPLPQGCSQMPDECGFKRSHNVSIFSSPDLSSGSWMFHGYAFPWTARPPGILYRPDVIYNAATQLYVLWVNVNNRPEFQGYFAATSASPAGPFSVVVPQVSLRRSGCGDFHLLANDDGSAYIIYSCGHYMGVEELSADYPSGTGAVSDIFPTYFVEAPMLFKRAGLYYALFGSCCCYCRQGSGVKVHTAPHPLGPWTLISNGTGGGRADGDVACVPPAREMRHPLLLPAPVDTPGQGCLYVNGTVGPADASVTRSQQNFIVTLSSGELVWTGNRWGQAPDGLKGHEPQAWLPLDFEADGSIVEMAWVDSFEITP